VRCAAGDGTAGAEGFPLCALFVFLVHSAEYESWSLPLAIILIAPMCLPFALLGTWLPGAGLRPGRCFPHSRAIHLRQREVQSILSLN
jgi:hypothetical protein